MGLSKQASNPLRQSTEKSEVISDHIEDNYDEDFEADIGDSQKPPTKSFYSATKPAE